MSLFWAFWGEWYFFLFSLTFKGLKLEDKQERIFHLFMQGWVWLDCCTVELVGV